MLSLVLLWRHNLMLQALLKVKKTCALRSLENEIEDIIAKIKNVV